MKNTIHPKYYPEAKVTCACGNTFITGSTLPEIKTDICANCHPFFTGEMKYIDTLGRVEKFKQKQQSMEKGKFLKKSLRKKLKENQEEKKADSQPKTLREMLQNKNVISKS